MPANISKLPGIYIHIPYCDTKCGYCDFYSITSSAGRRQFVPALKKEINHYSVSPFLEKTFDTMYMGGGTPSLLEPAELDVLFTYIFQKFSFSPNTEITIEVNPGTLNGEKLAFYRSIGINRLSIGVQSFFDSDLKYLGRIHSAQQAFSTVDLARKKGFENISIDLIFALPGQPAKNWHTNLETTIKIQPQHISAYNLIFEPGTPFYKKMLKGEIVPEKPEKELALYLETIETLNKAGYQHYEVSNFAANEKYFSRHNYKYWDHTPYLAFGPSAHSYWNNKRWSNVRNVTRYVQNMSHNKSVVDYSENLSQSELIFETIFLGLRTIAGIDLNNFRSSYGGSFLEWYKQLCRSLIDDGFAELYDNHFRLTRKGLMICDEILPRFAPN